jgi:hypothetical protein
MLSTLGRLDEAAGDRKGVPNWLSTHPDPLRRVAEIQPTVQKLKAGRTNFITDRDSLLRRVDGVIFGENPEQGITRGTTFLHPPLRFRIDFPAKWAVANSPRQVVAQAPDADVFMLLQVVTMPQGRTAQEVAVSSMQGAGFRLVEGERTTINGLEAFVGSYEGQIEELGIVGSRAAHILHNGACSRGRAVSDRFGRPTRPFSGAFAPPPLTAARQPSAVSAGPLMCARVTRGQDWPNGRAAPSDQRRWPS